MSRAYIVYIVMFAVLIGGLWLIIAIGASLEAPDDLAGEWTVAWEGAPPPQVNGASMRVAQSGRFFTVHFAGWPDVSLTLQKGWKGARDGRRLDMSLAGSVWKMNIVGDILLGDTIQQVRIELNGPSRHVGIARRAGDSATSRPAGAANAG